MAEAETPSGASTGQAPGADEVAMNKGQNTLREMLVKLRDEFQVWESSGDPRGPAWATRRIRRINRALAKADDDRLVASH